MKKISATSPADSSGRHHHIGAKAGDLAERILLVGDPDRVERVAKRFEKVRLKTQNREFVIVTGTYKGMEISVMGTGIGHDNTEIAVIEACQITKNPTFIRCGSCGALQSDVNLGDLIISKAAVRLDGTTRYFVEDGYPAAADPEVTMALAAASHGVGARFHMGITASAPSFYAAQGRSVEGFPARFPDLPEQLARQGVLNFEMEASMLFVLASLRGLRAGAICTVFANRPKDEFVDEATRVKGEESCIEASLAAFRILEKMDREKEKLKTPVWVPSGLTD